MFNTNATGCVENTPCIHTGLAESKDAESRAGSVPGANCLNSIAHVLRAALHLQQRAHPKTKLFLNSSVV